VVACGVKPQATRAAHDKEKEWGFFSGVQVEGDEVGRVRVNPRRITIPRGGGGAQPHAVHLQIREREQGIEPLELYTTRGRS